MDAACVLEKTRGERKSCKVKVGGGRKIKGARKTKLLKHLFALSSSYFLKNFLARYARSITFYFHSEISGCGTNTAGTVKFVSLLKVGRESVDFPSCTFDDLMSPKSDQIDHTKSKINIEFLLHWSPACQQDNKPKSVVS